MVGEEAVVGEASMFNPWTIGIGVALGGLNVGINADQRNKQRRQFDRAIDAEHSYRSQLQQQRSDLRRDTVSGMTDSLVASATTRNPNMSMTAKSAYDNISMTGRQGMREYDKSIADSVKMEQQLNAQKPSQYGVGDFFSDFIGGGVKGYQMGESFLANNQSKADASLFRKESLDKMRAWTDALKASTKMMSNYQAPMQQNAQPYNSFYPSNPIDPNERFNYGYY